MERDGPGWMLVLVISPRRSGSHPRFPPHISTETIGSWAHDTWRHAEKKSTSARGYNGTCHT